MANRQSGAAGFIPKPSGRLYLASNQQNLVNSANTFVLLDTVDSAFTDGIEDAVNNRIVPGIAGLYLVMASVCFDSVVANKHYKMNINITGSAKKVVYKHTALVNRLSCETIVPIRFTDTDEAKLSVISYAGVDTVDVLGGSFYTSLAVIRIG